MSQPVWFNKRLKLSKLTFFTDHTTKAKRAPLASLDVSTLMDLWNHENQQWYTPAQLAPWAAQAPNTNTIRYLYSFFWFI